MDLYRQTVALTKKTLKIVLTRHLVSAIYSALLLPILASVYLGVGLRLGRPNSEFGIGPIRQLYTLEEALTRAGGNRHTVAFVNDGRPSFAVDNVISSISDVVRAAGRTAVLLANDRQLASVCRNSIRGSSTCFGAVVFHSSPGDGNGDVWNYTLRADGSFGASFQVGSSDNDAQVYALPLQRAVDGAIADSALPKRSRQYAFTANTEDERRAQLRRDYQSSFVNYLGVAFIFALIGVCHHMPGLIVSERESGMLQLIDAMMPVRRSWHRQLVRFSSNHAAFCLVYSPGWILAAVICRLMIWKETSPGILIVFFVLGGVAIVSMSLLAASFFRKAQLSGLTTAILWIALGILAQALTSPRTTTVIVLSLLFTPCNFVFFVTYVARYEKGGFPTDLLHSPPDSPWKVPGMLLWVFLILQAFTYPLLAFLVERYQGGLTASSRSSIPAIEDGSEKNEIAVSLDNVSKIYRSSYLQAVFASTAAPRSAVVAAHQLTLTVRRGQILALLGANGSGKSTCLDMISGITEPSDGIISLDTTGGLGIAPQKDVFWGELTVEEHLEVFGQLKAPGTQGLAPEQFKGLIERIDLGDKAQAQAKTLSGGQKRKLQLGMMLVGNSALCCLDEVSSALDPLSRRKIWDILLAERGRRTIIMTTHFLDEAEVLADDIAVLSSGSLRAQGSCAQLKDTFGSGYRFYLLDCRPSVLVPKVAGVEHSPGTGTSTYMALSPEAAANFAWALERAQIRYKISSPTIEDVFLRLADEAGSSEVTPLSIGDANTNLLPGRAIGLIEQMAVFLRKRVVIFKSNWVPYVAAFLIPVIAAAISQLLVRNQGAAGCVPLNGNRQVYDDGLRRLFAGPSWIVSGPRTQFASGDRIDRLLGPLVPGRTGIQTIGGDRVLGGMTIKLVDSLPELQTLIQDNRKRVVPGGWWLASPGQEPALAFRADEYSMQAAVWMQSLLDSMLANTTIVSSYARFASPVPPSTGRALQLAIYFALACSVVSGLFGLYPNTERRLGIRGLQYSSGGRPLPLWLANIIFDYSILVLSALISAAILVFSSDVWYHGEYLFPVLILYSLVSILTAYSFSLFCASSLSTYALTAVFQGLGSAIYMIAYLYIVTFSPASAADRNILIGHWTISAFFPAGSLIRSLFVALNAFSTACDGDRLQRQAGAMTAYGGPILYLVLQAILLFALILGVESNDGKYATESAKASKEVSDAEIAREVVRVEGPGEKSGDGLRVVHLSKTFGEKIAVDNVTFGVGHGEIVALLGPNGAGKSTMVSLIRGDVAPSRGGGDVFIEKISMTKSRSLARQHLGVCPQFDALDQMTVREHLRHYARLRGIINIDQQVQAIAAVIGLGAYIDFKAQALSGGYKRKLSLAIALTGNPSVVLLDEPSCGLDAVAKRNMWRTLERMASGRCILLTTHSMEEAEVLAKRAGIMAGRMLALGPTDLLRRRLGDRLQVDLVSRTAPRCSVEEMGRIRKWILDSFPGVEVEEQSLHGQIRCSIPSSSVPTAYQRPREGQMHEADEETASPMGRLLVMLEANKEALGISHHSISRTTLDQIFLAIIKEHNVQEEGCERAKGAKKRRRSWWRWLWKPF